jgi:hypothetical protein
VTRGIYTLSWHHPHSQVPKDVSPEIREHEFTCSISRSARSDEPWIGAANGRRKSHSRRVELENSKWPSSEGPRIVKHCKASGKISRVRNPGDIIRCCNEDVACSRETQSGSCRKAGVNNAGKSTRHRIGDAPNIPRLVNGPGVVVRPVDGLCRIRGVVNRVDRLGAELRPPHRCSPTGNEGYEGADDVCPQRTPGPPAGGVLHNVHDIPYGTADVKQHIEEVSAGVRVLQRVVEDVGVPVEGLRIVGVLDNGVRADETPDGGIVVAGVVEVGITGEA